MSTPTLEIKVKADVKQAAIGLQTFLDEFQKAGLVSNTAAQKVQSSINQMTGAAKGFGNQKFSQSFVSSSGDIVQASEKIAGAGALLKNAFTGVGETTGIDNVTLALQNQANQFGVLIPDLKEFTALFSAPFLRQFGGDASKAQTALSATFNELKNGKTSFEQIILKAQLTEEEFEKLPRPLQRVVTIIQETAAAVKSGFGNISNASAQLKDGLDVAGAFQRLGQQIDESVDRAAAKALGLEKVFEKFGSSINLSAFVGAFSSADKSVEQLEQQIGTLGTAISKTTDPVLLERFGQQLNKLTGQLSNLKVVGSVKVEKIDIPQLNVPLVRPQIDLSALQGLKASFDSSIAPIDQLENKIKGFEAALKKATDPVLVASFRAEIERLKTLLGTLKFDKIDIDPTSMRVLQSAFIDANKPLEQLQKEIQIVEEALRQATANGSQDVGRLSEQLTFLKQKFDTINVTSLQSAFQEGVKSAQQLKDEIFSLGKSITASANPEDVIRFTDQIRVLQTQLNGLEFGGIDLQIDTSSLTRLQSAFIDAIKPAKQLEEEIEALEQALHITADPKSIEVFTNRVVELKNQLNNAKFGNFEKNFSRTGKAAQDAGNKFRPFVKGSNEALRATVDMGRILQDLPFGFIGIANNLNPMLESFQRLGKESGGLKGALKALGGSLIGPGGLALALSAFQFIALDGVSAVKKMFGGVDEAKLKAEKLKKAAEEAKAAAEAFVSSLNDVAQANIKGAQNAQGELLNVQLLYDATQNQNLAYKERKKAVDALQEQYPKYFKNISDETILAGGAKAAYDKLSDAILATAKARASSDKITEIAKENLVLEEQRTGVLKEQLRAALQLAKARRDLNKASDEGIVTAGGFGGSGSFGKTSRQTDLETAQQVFNGKLKETNAIQDKINKNVEKQKELTQNITSLVSSNGVDTIIGATSKAIEEKAEKQKFNFFDHFFDLKPPKQDVEKQLKDMFDTAREFAQKNVDLFKVKVGGEFIDLSELNKVSDRREVVELGKKIWSSIQNGLIKFKPPKIDLEELAADISLVPVDNSEQQADALITFYINAFERLQDAANIDVKINLEEVKKADAIFKSIQKKIEEFSKAVGKVGASFGNPISDVFSKIISATLNRELKKGLQAGMNAEQLKKFEARLAELGANMAASFGLFSEVLSGLQGGFEGFFETIITGGGNAFQKLGQAISGMITKLVASLAAMAAISGLLSLFGFGGFSSIFKGMIGSKFGVPGFASGGLVFGPTMGLVGEGSGTSRSNPEIIAPLDKLKNFLTPNNNAASERLIAQVSGQNIDLVLQRFYGKQRRNG